MGFKVSGLLFGVGLGLRILEFWGLELDLKFKVGDS